LAAFNSADREALLAYHQECFPYSAASHDVADIEREHGLSVGTHGFSERQVEESTATTLSIVLQEHRGPQFARVHIEVEPDPPHVVKAFTIGPIPTPLQFSSSVEQEHRRVDGKRRQAVIDSLRQELIAHYVSAELAQKMADGLGEKVSLGGYDEIVDAVQFAVTLTEDLQAVSHDKHLRVRFGPPPSPPPESPAGSDAPPWMVQQNFGFGAVERLSANVGLLTINRFVPALNQAVKDAIGARISPIADADAVIIDLRNNGGGWPETVALIASYFFGPKPLHLSDIKRRDTGEVKQFWSESTLAGTRFGAKKPVYVLTSSRTFSGGEDLAYTLQAHQRALVVGETTAGGAHPVELRALDADLFVTMPWGESINPITKGNWEGTGVQPDLAAPAPEALERALEALAAKQTKKH
jgi:C-terminal processing protease CtpA/Prc